MTIGIFPGSFNPIHMGHLILLRYWLNHTDLAQIWLVVSPHNPFKAAHELAPFEHRLAMVRLSVAGESRLLASDAEAHLPKPSYTIQLLKYLRREYPTWNWALLLGADAACSLPSWREGKRILEEWTIWVYPRRNTNPSDLPKGNYLRFFEEAPLIEISATQVRQYLASGLSIRYLVLPEVENYLHTYALYRT
ncbi:MAG: nicotinate (nicotinamide) nucleotide adenylyltransferase [Bacteroidia bacterium]|nr:nicotinate (nicotinamide) nucleotide adenylyltransferase [Bacteroidia bacterium]MDW8235475.1 nicotinate (nicotinamide) nucleotide adenylyltransferase [Bacteroidia bacterium]